MCYLLASVLPDREVRRGKVKDWLGVGRVWWVRGGESWYVTRGYYSLPGRVYSSYEIVKYMQHWYWLIQRTTLDLNRYARWYGGSDFMVRVGSRNVRNGDLGIVNTIPGWLFWL